MESCELVEIRKGGVWIVGQLASRNESDIFVYIDSFDTYITVKAKDFTDFRTNTSDKIGSQYVMNLINFMESGYVMNMIDSISSLNFINKAWFNQNVRGKIYFCLLQFMEYNYNQQTELLQQVETIIYKIFEMYLNILNRKIRLVDDKNCDCGNAYSAAYPEIESAFLIILGLEEPGIRFYNDYKGKLQQYIYEHIEMDFSENVANKIILESSSILKLNSDSDDLFSFVELLIKCLNKMKDKLNTNEITLNSQIKEYLERTLNHSNFDINKKDFTKIFALLNHFKLSTKVISDIFLDFLQKNISITQTLQIFSSLDTIDDKELIVLIEVIDNSKVYLKTLKNESLLKYLIKYIRLLRNKRNISELFYEIFDKILERDILVAFLKVVANNLQFFNFQECLTIFELFIEKYSADCKSEVTSFINKLFSIYNFQELSQINNLLYRKIPKTEAIRILRNVVTLSENQGRFNHFLEHIFSSLDSDLSNELLLELIDSKEFLTNFYSSEIILDRICSLIAISNRAFTLLKCLLKFDFNINRDENSSFEGNNKIQKVENMLISLFHVCLSEEKLMELYLKVICQVNNIEILEKIAEICLKDLEKSRNWESEEKVFLALFMKINSRSLTFSPKFWENNFFTENVYRKSGNKLKLEQGLFFLFFYEKLTNKSKLEYMNLIMALHSKFDTSAAWTKEIWKKFMINFFNHPNTLSKFEIYYQLSEQNTGLETGITVIRIIENLKDTKESNNYDILFYRKILQSIKNDDIQIPYIQGFLKNCQNFRFSLIIIERIINLVPINEIRSIFIEIVNKVEEPIFSQIVFSLLSEKNDLIDVNYQIPNFLFENFLKPNKNLYSETDTGICFEALFYRLNQLEYYNKIKLYCHCLILIFKQESFENEKLIEEFNKNKESSGIECLVNEFLNSFLNDKQLILTNISDEAKDIFSKLLHPPKLREYENLLINHLKMNINDLKILENVLKLLLCVKFKQAHLYSNESELGLNLLDLLESLFNTYEFYPKICQETFKEQFMMLFTYYPKCREAITKKFYSFFNKNHLKLQSKPIKFVLVPKKFPRTMKNFGATCYINSIIQLIFEIDPLVAQLLTYNGGNNSLNALKHILMCLKYSVKSSVNSKILLNSYETYDGCFIDKNVQSDAEEFLNTILYKLQDEGWDLKRSLEFSTVTKLNCNCGESCIKEPDISYVLHLEVSGMETIEKSIEAYLNIQKIDESNSITCETCQKKDIKQRQCSIKEWPNYLICVLKRFRFNLELGKSEKLMDEIALKSVLVKDDNIYDLCLIVLHIGKTENGHYITLKKSGNVWYKIDDTNVTVLDDFDPEKNEACNISPELTPYLILYKKTNISLMNEDTQIEEKLKEKNIQFCESCIYFGEPMIHFLINMVNKDIPFCVDALVYALPYQVHGAKILFMVYKKICEELEGKNLKLEFIENLKTKSTVIIQILTGATNDNYQLVFKSLLKEVYTDNLTELLNTLFQILGNDHTAHNFTFIIELIIELLQKYQEKENYVNYLMFYFFFKKVQNYPGLEIKKNGIEWTNFSSFFRYIYTENIRYCDEYFKLENLYYLVNFYCFQVDPKHYSKLMAKTVVEKNLTHDYFNFIINITINLQLKQRMVYDFIEEYKDVNSIFSTEVFKSLIINISSNESEIKLIEKILKALSRKLKNGKKDIDNILNHFLSNKKPRISAEGFLIKIFEDNKKKIDSIAYEILNGTIFKKIKKNEDILSISLKQVDTFGEIEVLNSEGSLKLVKLRN